VLYNIFVLHNFTLNHVSLSHKITFLSPKTWHINWHKSVSFNGFIDVGLLEFGLTMQMGEVLHVIYFQPMSQLWAQFCMSLLHVKISLSYVVFKSGMWYFQIVHPCMHLSFLQEIMFVLIFKLSKCLFEFLISKKYIIIIIYLVLYQSHLFRS
jgi:hypothetical protein